MESLAQQAQKYVQSPLLGLNGSLLDPLREQTLLKRANREYRELELERQRGNLVPRAVVQQQWLANAAAMKALVLSIPSRIRQELHLSLPQEDEMDAIVDQMLREFSQQSLDPAADPTETPGSKVSERVVGASNPYQPPPSRPFIQDEDFKPRTKTGRPDKRYRKRG